MANQPKKYTKFVATAATATLVASAIVPVASAASLSDISGNTHEEAINALVSDGIISGYQDGTFKPNKELTRSDVVKLLGKFLETKGYEAAADYKTRPAFADLTTKTNEELLKYASVVKEAGVFVGSNGNLLAGDPITRENMAITLVRTVNTVNDISLEEYVATQDFKGDVTDLTQAKAEARSAISVLDFYDITNPAAPAFNPKGNTTRGQFASFLYKTINADYTAAGQKDEEASSVLPTAIAFEETSIQAGFGETVTLKAKVTVKEGESAANIPVKFDVYTNSTTANDTTIVPQLTETVKTDANGVATYTYTRSQGSTDTIAAYATGKPALKAHANVYWAQSLVIKDITTESTLTNNTQKVYEVNGVAGTYVYVTFKENLGVSPDKAVKAKLQGIVKYGAGTTADSVVVSSSDFPYEYTTGGTVFGAVKLDANGKANIVVTGEDTSVTPLVYTYGDKVLPTVLDDFKYSSRALQATGTTVTFQKTDILALSVTPEGSANAAVRLLGTKEIGGRDYVATLTDKNGKAIAFADVYVQFDRTNSSEINTLALFNTKGELINSVKDVPGELKVFKLTTDKDGKAKFTVANDKADSYAKPLVFVDSIKSGSSFETVDKNEVQQLSEIVTFSNMQSTNYTGKLITSVATNDTAQVSNVKPNSNVVYTYQLSDQNGKPRSYRNSQTKVTFTVTNGTASSITVGDRTILANSSDSFDVTMALTDTNAQLTILTGSSTGVITVSASPSNTGLALSPLSSSVNVSNAAATSEYVIESNSTLSTIDSVTLTFTEAVSNSAVSAYSLAGGSTVALPTPEQVSEKVLRVHFVNRLVLGDQFKIYFNGKVRTFEVSTNGALTEIK